MFHLVLLAKNQEGYHNLCKMDSIASTDAYYYKPRINHEILEKHKEGIICLSACIQGEIARNFLDGLETVAEESVKYYKIFLAKIFTLSFKTTGLKSRKILTRF